MEWIDYLRLLPWQPFGLLCLALSQGVLAWEVRLFLRGDTRSLTGRFTLKAPGRRAYGSAQRAPSTRGRRSALRNSRSRLDGTTMDSGQVVLAQVQLERVAESAGCSVEEVLEAWGRGSHPNPQDSAREPAGAVGDDADADGVGVAGPRRAGP